MRNELIKLLTDAGLSKDEATSKVDKLYATVKKIRPQDSEDSLWALVKLKVLEYVNILKRSGATRFTGVVIGFTEYRDVLEPVKRAILDEYERDPQGAIMQGLVRVEHDGTVVPLDNRPTLPTGDPNPHFGKPIPTLYSRNIHMIVDNQYRRAQGDIKDEPRIGGIYSFAGTERGDVIRISRIRPFRMVGTVQPSDLWNMTLKALKPFAIDLHDLTGNEENIIAIKGMVTYTTETSTGNQLIVVDDPDEPIGEGVPVFVNPKTISAPIVTGSEVITFGTTFTSTVFEEQRVGINGFGVIVNPAVSYGDVLESLDEVLWEG